MRGLWTDAWGCGLRGRRCCLPGAFVDVRRVLWVSLAVLCVLVGASLLASAPALAAGRRGHVFSFAFGESGEGDGQFSDPTGVAVNNATGDVYVADRKNNRVDQFRPVVREGELAGEEYVRSFAAASPRGVAVDDSTEESDPSKGDVYVVGKKAIQKFSPEGQAIGELKKFEIDGVKEKFETIEGVAVDSSWALFVYQAGGVIDTFDDAVANEGQSSMQVDAGQSAERGFALDSNDNLYVGVEGKGGLPVVARLEGITGKVLVPELDGEDTTAVAVNPTDDVEATGVDELDDVYVVNVAGSGRDAVSTVAEFAVKRGAGGQEEAELIQRFGVAGLKEGDGIAVDAQSGAVYVADAASDEVDVFELELPGPPTVEGLSATSAASAAADARRLVAQVNPMGADTRYYFEYGTGSCASVPSTCTRAPASPGDVGEGVGDREASVEVTSLPPGAYHYRIVAENALGTGRSAEGTFTIVTLARGLLDGRAWEMVSPPDKHGAPVEALTREGGLILAAEGGDAITYVADGAITEEAQGNRSPEMQQVISTRGPEGWSSQDIVTPQTRAQALEVGRAPEYQFFSPDLSLALVEPAGGAEPPLAPGVTKKTMYVRDNATGAYLPLVTEANVAPGTGFGDQVNFVSATPDLSHVILSSGVALTGSSSGPGLYEWAQGKLQFVSVLPSGVPAHEPELGYYHVAANAVSSDGSRVIWTTFEEGLHRGHLYMRDTASGETIQLDAAQGVAEPGGVGVAQFQSASSDGSRVFFTDKQRLTADSTAEPGAENAGKADLYECEILEEHGKLACKLSDLTVDHTAGGHAAVQGFLFGAGEDGSTVYLVAQGVLASNENGSGEGAEPGGENLYELHDAGTEWSRTFIAVLSSEDKAEWGEGVIPGDTAFLTARVSPNGRYLAFMSAASPTGYDNEDATSKHVGERLDEEVYLYDSSSASLTCVSCDPTGARPVGVFDTVESGEGLGLLVDRRGVWLGHWLAGNIPGWTAQSIVSALYQSRYLSNEGRLFFNSPDDLVAQASNHKEDVYEYGPAGVGSCESSSGGCVALISSGSSAEESAFLEATPSGNDVFFLTAAKLLPQDTDTAFDVYDARVCTQESPCLTPPPPPPAGCSTADACRPAPPPQQAPVGPSGSAAFSGAGNIVQPLAAAQEVKGVKASAKPLTRAQKLADALKACRKQHSHSRKKRKACEAHSRKLYGPKTKAKSKTNAKKSSSGRSTGRGGR